MSEPDDHDLLAQYALGPRADSEAAFTALAERYLNLVYSTALRNVGDAHAAQEIAQAVFIILANKAGKLSRQVVLSGWLYQTAWLTAANFLRGEIRRQKREQEAFMQSTLQEPAGDPAWGQIAPLLDDALGKLGERDRNAIVLRFFENKNLREVGLALGASEDAAKMRVNRALEKLRKIFGQRGAVFSAVAIAGAVSANSVQAAPLGLAKTVSALALTKGATASGSTLALVKGALKLMAWSKMQTAMVATAIILLAAGTTTVVVTEIHAHQNNAWQLAQISGQIFQEAPHKIIILPTQSTERSPRNGSGGTYSLIDGRRLFINQSLQIILDMICLKGLADPTRIIMNAPDDGKKYDVLSNLPEDSDKALQQAIKRKFGLMGSFQTINTNVLALQVKPGYVAKLKINSGPGNEFAVNMGNIFCQRATMDDLARALESNCFPRPVANQTGLTNLYEFDLSWDSRDPEHSLSNLKQALADQLGLELVPTNLPIEMLVIDKAKPLKK